MSIKDQIADVGRTNKAQIMEKADELIDEKDKEIKRLKKMLEDAQSESVPKVQSTEVVQETDGFKITSATLENGEVVENLEIKRKHYKRESTVEMKWYKIELQREQGFDKKIKFHNFTVNGKTYPVLYAPHQAWIPETVKEGLDNAVSYETRTEINPNTGTPAICVDESGEAIRDKVRRFNYTVLEEAVLNDIEGGQRYKELLKNAGVIK